jgi:magnesium chelatase family protein
VEAARALQQQRCGKVNAHLTQSEIAAHCRLGAAEQGLLERAAESLRLSARSVHRILRVARTIADLGDSPEITGRHLGEAIGYRLERAVPSAHP